VTTKVGEPPLTWVIGYRGLLGSAVVRRLHAAGAPVTTVPVPWHDPDAAVRALDSGAGRLARAGRPWRIAWCAGAGVIGTTEECLQAELEVLEGFLARLPDRFARAGAQPGCLFLASSAGGVYAGSAGAPFTESTTPRPISPYGEAKLAAEGLVDDFSTRSGVPTVVGRIANLYGPGQDISKPQGVISQLCLSHLRRQAISLYVPLDTARDYLFVDDCAAMVLAALEHGAATGGQLTKVLASGQATTLASILGVLKQVTKRSPRVVLGGSQLARFQARDLRFRSVAEPELQSHARTTLAAGIACTTESLARLVREGRLAS
jgi:UDP-glucose 4-epimerase